MLIDQQAQNILKVLNLDGIPNKVEQALSLRLGQIVQGKVIQFLSPGKTLINVQGAPLVAEVNTGLKEGSSFSARVQQVSPLPVLKIEPQGTQDTVNIRNPLDASRQTTIQPGIRSQSGEQALPSLLTKTQLNSLNLKLGQTFQAEFVETTAKGTLLVRHQGKLLEIVNPKGLRPAPGEVLNLTVQKGFNGIQISADPAQRETPTVPLSLIKNYLPLKKPLGDIVQGLQSTLSRINSHQSLKLDTQLLRDIQQTLSALTRLDTTSFDAKSLQKLVDLSGINYESKLKNLIAGNTNKSLDSSLKLDLKGQLLRLQNHLENVESADSRIPLPPSKLVTELVQQVRNGVDGIEFQQLANQFARQENQPISLQIPYLVNGEGKTLQIHIKRDQKGGSEQNLEKQGFHMVFLLNMTALGDLKIDTFIKDSAVSIKFFSASQKIVDFIQMNGGQLKDQLNEIGIQAEVSSSLQSKSELAVEDPLNDVMVKKFSRLVDIQT